MKYDSFLKTMNFKLNSAVILITLCVISGDVFGADVRVVELTNGWTLKNQNGSIQVNVGKIPSGVYTTTSSLFGSILESYNDVNLRWIGYDNWTYTNRFEVEEKDLKDVRFINLTLHGIDTVAEVRLNNITIGVTDDMFVRFSFDVLSYLKSSNVLEILLISPIYVVRQHSKLLKGKNITAPPDCPHLRIHGECHGNLLRKMQSSFGNEVNLAALSMGIWKPVTLEYYDMALIGDIDVALSKNGTHWILDMRVFLEAGIREKFLADLTFFAPNLLQSPLNLKQRSITVNSPVINFHQAIPIGNVELWWPNGYGQQKLYPLYFTVNCWAKSNGLTLRQKSKSHKSIKIGFRTLELVEDVVENGRTFFFKANDKEIFVKGANYLPAHILPEQSDNAQRVQHLLRSAKQSHLNMLRVWGGGLYESDYFYDLADEYGLLIWQDMAFSSATYPITEEFVESVRLETVQNAKRLSHHPSLALFVTNNEVELNLIENNFNTDFNYQRFYDDYRQLFLGTINHELNIISRSSYRPRPGPLRSTPSNGMEGDRKELSAKPQDPCFGDVHIWEENKDGWNPDAYPRPRFASEYGYQSLPSVGAWQRTMKDSDNLTELIIHREHDQKAAQAMIRVMRLHLPLPTKRDEHYFEALIYLSQISQAMATKTATELFRSLRETEYRTMGALYWHLNDVWVAPTWSSIDFFGNFKILYYWSREFMAPTTIIALADAANRAINVTLVRDEINVNPEVFDVIINIYLWSEVYALRTIKWQTILRDSDVQLKVLPFQNVFDEKLTPNKTFLEFILYSNGNIKARNFFLPVNLTQAVGIMDPELKVDISWKYCNIDAKSFGKINSYSLTIHISRPAVFVYIEIIHPKVEKYALSKNGFMQMNPVQSIQLEFWHPSDCLTLSMENIHVQTVNQYMSSAVSDKASG